MMDSAHCRWRGYLDPTPCRGRATYAAYCTESHIYQYCIVPSSL